MCAKVVAKKPAAKKSIPEVLVKNSKTKAAKVSKVSKVAKVAKVEKEEKILGDYD